MRIYIVGSVASGKTTLAKKLSKLIDIQCFHLDEIVHIKNAANKEWGNIRRTDKDITQLFTAIINKPNWIIEDAGRKIFDEGLKKADVIIFLEPNIFIRRLRIFIRYLKQKIGIEKCLYRPSFHMLRFMYKAVNNYETGKDDLKTRINFYSGKLVSLNTKKEFNRFIDSSLLSNENQFT